jgi:geranylgeranyl pyrophosphate synthase
MNLGKCRSQEKVKHVAEIWEKLGVPDAVRTEIKHYHQKAIACLDTLNVPKEHTAELRQFANELLERTF